MAHGVRGDQAILAVADADPSRLENVTILGVDEHVWHHVSTRPVEDGGRGPKELTGMVDLTGDGTAARGLACWTWSPAAPVRPTRHGCVNVARASGRRFSLGPVPRVQERER